MHEFGFTNTRSAAVREDSPVSLTKLQPHANYVRIIEQRTRWQHLLALQLVLLDVEGGIEQILLFLQMAALETGGNTCAWVSSGVENMSSVVVLGLVQHRLDTRLSEGPCTGVQRLLLGPDNVLGVRV